MNKEEVRKRIHDAGDAIVTYRSAQSKRMKYNVCTVDFTTPYIASRPCQVSEDLDTVLTWAWDTDSYRLIKASAVVSIQPMSSVLRNRSPEDG